MKYWVKKVRKEYDDEEWEGVLVDEKGNSDDESDLEMESGLDLEDEDEMDVDEKLLISDFDGKGKGKEGFLKCVNWFFENEVFVDILGEMEEEGDGEEEEV